MSTYKSQQEDAKRRLMEDLLIAALETKDSDGKALAYNLPFNIAEQMAEHLLSMGYREV